MTKELIVDPAGLRAAGEVLQRLIFPAVPTPIVMPVADPVTAAVTETAALIEAPVVEGLPAAEQALAKSSVSIIEAAKRYAETDSSLGEYIDKTAFGEYGPPPVRSAKRGAGGVSAAPTAAVPSAAAEPAPTPAATPAARVTEAVAPAITLPSAAEFGAQAEQMAGIVGFAAQGVQQGTQFVGQAAQGVGSQFDSTGVAPTRLAGEPVEAEKASEADQSAPSVAAGHGVGERPLPLAAVATDESVSNEKEGRVDAG